jgi:hypothetical protein
MLVLRFIITFLACFVSISAVAASNSIPAAYYVGPGDGSVVVFHVFHNDKATIGAVESYTGGGWRPTPVTQKEVVSAAQTKHGAWLGTLKKTSPDHYRFVLGTPAHKNSYCIHSVTETPKGLLFQQQKMQVGCMYYHGASWGYSSPVRAPLHPYMK